MARQTTYLVQSFKIGRGGNLSAEKPVTCKSSDAAQHMAESLADTKIGVVAFSSSGDAELGEFDDEPVIIFKAGRLPESFEG